MVSKAHVLSANSPDFSDIMTRHASGVPENNNILSSNKCTVIDDCFNAHLAIFRLNTTKVVKINILPGHWYKHKHATKVSLNVLLGTEYHFHKK